MALQDLSKYTYENGGWYDVHRGFYDAPTNNKFFYQFGGPITSYDLNAQITFTSFDSTAVTDQATNLVSTKNADGSTTHTHLC